MNDNNNENQLLAFHHCHQNSLKEFKMNHIDAIFHITQPVI